ncbi:unnamed protein product [Schistosoma curassoni]|uniref:Uncharacterized protein n=1 Tax=Schistosoma curassoni TaxID=6186 RepID=A0A183JDG4_9TREM|nr:unnamed protein product [Schistosoma curassoni]
MCMCHNQQFLELLEPSSLEYHKMYATLSLHQQVLIHQNQSLL